MHRQFQLNVHADDRIEQDEENEEREEAKDEGSDPLLKSESDNEEESVAAPAPKKKVKGKPKAKGKPKTKAKAQSTPTPKAKARPKPKPKAAKCKAKAKPKPTTSTAEATAEATAAASSTAEATAAPTAELPGVSVPIGDAAEHPERVAATPAVLALVGSRPLTAAAFAAVENVGDDTLQSHRLLAALVATKPLCRSVGLRASRIPFGAAAPAGRG